MPRPRRSRHRNDDIRIRGMLARQQAAQHLPRFLHRAAEDDRIRTRKIDMLKRALRQRPLRRVALAGDSLGTHYDHFARLHIVQVHRSDQIERAGFGCEDVSGVAVQFHLPHGQRAEAVRIARHDDAVLGQEHQRESALDLQQRIAQSASQRALGGVRHQVQDHLGIAIGLEDGAAPLQLRAQLNGVGDVAVARRRHAAVGTNDRSPRRAAR